MLTILKHAKNFVGKSDTSPIFKGIHFTGSEIVVSNTHVLVIRTNFPSEKKTIHWGTGELIDGVYPDAMKCIPPESQITFDFTDLKAWIRALKMAVQVSGECSLLSDPRGVILQAQGERQLYQATFDINLKKGTPLERITFNPKYLHDILCFFKDSGVTVVTMGFNNRQSIIKLTTDKVVLAVLTPIRPQ
jgi:DNA polymerase III sliding clamp (beta) subunit (PCNA family)